MVLPRVVNIMKRESMTKREIAIASQAYREGYEQACKDCVKSFLQVRQQTFDASMASFAKMVDDGMQLAVNAHFDALCKKNGKAHEK